MKFHKASDLDLDQLANWNHQLIADEGHRNRMDPAALRERMAKWLAGSYEAVVFSDETEQPVAYALYRDDGENGIYLRQFFVCRDRRRQGIGRAAMNALFDRVWPKDRRLTVDVLAENDSAIAFWRAVGYRDYCLSLEIPASGGESRAGNEADE